MTNFEIEPQNEPQFNGFYSRNNLAKNVKDGAYVIDLNEYEKVGTHWVVFHVKIDEVTF